MQLYRDLLPLLSNLRSVSGYIWRESDMCLVCNSIWHVDMCADVLMKDRREELSGKFFDASGDQIHPVHYSKAFWVASREPKCFSGFMSSSWCRTRWLKWRWFRMDLVQRPVHQSFSAWNDDLWTRQNEYRSTQTRIVTAFRRRITIHTIHKVILRSDEPTISNIEASCI